MEALKQAVGKIRGFSPSQAASSAYTSIGKNTLIMLFTGLLALCVVVAYTVYSIVTNVSVNVTYVKATNTGIQTGSAPSVTTNAVNFTGATSGTILLWAFINKLPSGSVIPLVSIGAAPSPPTAAGAAPASGTPNTQNLEFTIDTTKGSPAMRINMACASGSCTTPENVLIPYVPTKRWVHYAVTVDLIKGTAIAYSDGELITPQGTVTSASVFPVGNNLVIAGMPGLESIVSQVGYVAQVMTAAQIQKEYYKGPMYTNYSFLGLSAYGLRSPVYSLNN